MPKQIRNATIRSGDIMRSAPGRAYYIGSLIVLAISVSIGLIEFAVGASDFLASMFTALLQAIIAHYFKKRMLGVDARVFYVKVYPDDRYAGTTDAFFFIAACLLTVMLILG
jgi:hypothetical protein